MRKRLAVAIVACIVATSAGCDERKERCHLNSKGYALFTVDGKDWAFPREVCSLLAKAIAESSDSTRTDLFGMGADAWKVPQPCTCE